MGILKTDPNEIITICEELKRVNFDARKIIVNYNEMLSRLDSAWEGEEQAGFKNHITEHMQNIEQLAEICDEYCEYLSDVAKCYLTAESSFANNIVDVLPGDVIV